MNETLKDLNYPGISQEEGKIFQQVYEEELDNITMHPEVTKLLDTLQEKEDSDGDYYKWSNRPSI